MYGPKRYIANEPPAIHGTNAEAIPLCGIAQIRYDINVKLSNGELANVEMTKVSDSLEVLRMEYYLTRLHCGQEIRGKAKNFTDLKKSWQISLLADTNVFKDKALVHHFEYYDKLNRTVFGGRTAIITLELRKLRAIELKPVKEMTALERWAYFFRCFIVRAAGRRPAQMAHNYKWTHKPPEYQIIG